MSPSPSTTMPISQPICTCISHGCGKKETTDERGHRYQGKRVGVQEYQDHRRHDKRLMYMAHRQEPEGDTSASPDGQSSVPMAQSTAIGPEDLNHDLEEPQSVVDAPGGAGASISAGNYTTSWTSQEDELASTLEDSVSVFRSGLHQFHNISIKDLVFCEPSKDDETLIPPPLQSHAATNIQFLQYHDWVAELYVSTNKLDCGGFERCRRTKDQLLDNLRNEWTKLEELKHRAWQLASLRHPSPGPGLAQKIDTRECRCDPS
jgi:hypothetical protein